MNNYQIGAQKSWAKRRKNGTDKPWNKGIKVPQNSGEKNGNWKGDEVSYSALHHWVYRHLGKPKKCEHCGTTKRLQWASISHKATRDVNDYFALCDPCHRKYDYRTDTNRGMNNKLSKEYFNRWTKKWELKTIK